jgi:hypothetical protein
MFSHLIYFIKKCYKFCTFNVTCKDNAALNYIAVQHKAFSFLSTLTGHTYYASAYHITLWGHNHPASVDSSCTEYCEIQFTLLTEVDIA